jgi:hypothetical protein
MKHAVISSVSGGGYMYSLNCTMNALKYFGTRADFHLLYYGNPKSIKQEYKDACSSAFPFKVVWIPVSDFDGKGMHNVKYVYAKTLKGQYDSVCLIDGDYSLYTDITDILERSAKEDIIISGVHAFGRKQMWEDKYFEDPELVNDKCRNYLADFPLCINPNLDRVQELLHRWWLNTNDPSKFISSEYNRVTVVLNRTVCELYKKEEIIALDHNQWLNDHSTGRANWNLWGDKLYNDEGQRIHAIHHKWWKSGRAGAVWRGGIRTTKDNIAGMNRLRQAERNINTVKLYMECLNAMTPSTAWYEGVEPYPISRVKYLKEAGLWNEEIHGE